jgi:serine/threonine-protein kinase
MGTVWEAHHKRLPGKRVAIKILQSSIADDPETLARFRREAEIACRLGHPNIVEVHDFNKLDGDSAETGSPYLVLELLDGTSLDERLRQGPLSVQESLPIVRQIASALQCAHDQGVVHRDLKPQNVFLVPSPTGDGPPIVKILDFGISKIRGSQTLKTHDNTLLGTPQYMAPEQATGDHDRVDGRTDEFAFGAMVYEMLSGVPAFGGQNIPEVVYKVVHGEPRPIGELVPGVGEAQASAVHRALSKNRDDRFADVTAFAEAFTGSSIPVHQTGAPASPAKSELASAATVDSSKLHLAQAETVASAKLDAAVAETIDSSKLDKVQASVEIQGVEGATVESVAVREATPRPGPDDTGAATSPDASGAKRYVISLVVVCGAAALAFVMMRSPSRQASTVASVEPREESAVAADGEAQKLRPGPATAIEKGSAGEQGETTADDGTAVDTDGKEASDEGSAAPIDAGDTQAVAASGEQHDGDESGSDENGSDENGSDENGATDGADEPANHRFLADLEPEARNLLVQARKALRRGDYRQALVLAKRADRVENNVQSYFIQGQAYCHLQDVGMLNAARRNLPRRLKRRLARYCKSIGFAP